MKKPIQKQKHPHWNYHEVIQYIEEKYKIQTRGYTPKNSFTSAQIKERDERYPGWEIPPLPYLDFWHWLISINSSIHNGCYFTLDPEILLDETEEEVPSWVKEILQMIKDEFPDAGEMYFWVEW